jgi:hypothetical protein
MMSGRKADRDTEGLARRDFLRTAGVGVVAGVGAAIVGGADEAAATEPAPAAKGRYRETDHVRRVYDLSRF